MYKFASHVQVPTSNQLSYLNNLGLLNKKLSLIPDWVDPSILKPQEKYNHFRKKNQFSNKFLLVYSGNFGYSSDLKTVIESANILKKNKDIHFVLAGEGVIKNELVKTAKNLSLKNVTFLPFQSRQDFAEILASADMGIITLNDDFPAR